MRNAVYGSIRIVALNVAYGSIRVSALNGGYELLATNDHATNSPLKNASSHNWPLRKVSSKR